MRRFFLFDGMLIFILSCRVGAGYLMRFMQIHFIGSILHLYAHFRLMFEL